MYVCTYVEPSIGQVGTTQDETTKGGGGFFTLAGCREPIGRSQVPTAHVMEGVGWAAGTASV
jgi:hypothetical protein